MSSEQWDKRALGVVQRSIDILKVRRSATEHLLHQITSDIERLEADKKTLIQRNKDVTVFVGATVYHKDTTCGWLRGSSGTPMLRGDAEAACYTPCQSYNCYKGEATEVHAA